jgi:hypothetical protein
MWELKKFCVMSKNTSKLEPETSLLPIGCRDRKVLFGLVSWTQNVWKKLKELGVNISVTIRYNYKPDDSIMLLLRFSAFALALAKATGVLFRAAFLHSFPSTRPKWLCGYAWSARGTFSMLSKSIIAILIPLRRTKFAPLASF